MPRQQIEGEEVDQIGNNGPQAKQDGVAQCVEGALAANDVMRDQGEGGKHRHQPSQIVIFTAGAEGDQQNRQGSDQRFERESHSWILMLAVRPTFPREGVIYLKRLVHRGKAAVGASVADLLTIDVFNLRHGLFEGFRLLLIF